MALSGGPRRLTHVKARPILLVGSDRKAGETMVSAVDRIKAQLGLVHGFMEQTMADVTAEICQQQFPDSTEGSIGAAYAHCIFGEDRTIHGFMQGGKPTVYESGGWASKLNVVPPPMGAQTLEWARSFKLSDLDTFREYAKAVQAETDKYVASLSDSDLDRKLDTRVLGEQTLAWIFDVFLITHYPTHMGEIAALKGVMGHKGLPF
jgi:hypothetical protein